MNAPDGGVMSVGRDRERKAQFGLRKRRRIGDRSEIRGRIVARFKAVGVDMAEISDGRLRASIRLAVGEPQRSVIALGIIGFERGSLLLAAEHPVEFSAGEI